MDRYTKPVDTASFVFLSFLFRISDGNLTGDVVSREIQRVSIYIYSLRFPRGGCEKPVTVARFIRSREIGILKQKSSKSCNRSIARGLAFERCSLPVVLSFGANTSVSKKKKKKKKEKENGRLTNKEFLALPKVKGKKSNISSEARSIVLLS